MPHHHDDERYPHLILVREDATPDRRKSQGRSPRETRNAEGRRAFSTELRQELESIEQERKRRPSPVKGIRPHLVFKIPLVKGAEVDALEDRLRKIGVEVVGIEPEKKAIIAFHDDEDLREFRNAVAQYEQGPQEGINPKTNEPYKSTQWDVLEDISPAEMRIWSPEDRIGQRLADRIAPNSSKIVNDEHYILDIEMWHRGTKNQADQTLTELRRFIEAQGSEEDKLCDWFVGDSLCLARVKVRGKTLRMLLEIDIVAEVEIPPEPVFDRVAAGRVTQKDFPVPPAPPEDGPRVCILDSGVASVHPLLRNNFGHAEAILTAQTTSADQNGHGTMVGGIAVFGDIRAAYLSGAFESPVTLFSARVLNDHNGFDDDQLILKQMRTAIAVFMKPPYNCRVFNLSLGDNRPALKNGRQSEWAEVLDTIAREMKVLLVVSAGNNQSIFAKQASDAETVLSEYPRYLLSEASGIADPGTAAIPITVGSLAKEDAPEVLRNADDLVPAVANAGQPSPFTRTGPGVNMAIKPEFVADGGNVLFSGTGSVHRVIKTDSGVGVMSLSHVPSKQMFAYWAGTSCSAPQIARLAAMAWTQLREYLNEDPHPNLVRALLANTAVVPSATKTMTIFQKEANLLRVCGYGTPDEEFLMESAGRRVTLIAQDRIVIDTFRIYEVPVPSEFKNAHRKQITVTLAYDPPVRRRRADYLGVKMEFDLFRGVTIENIVEAYKAVAGKDREDQEPAIQGRWRCSLVPGKKRMATSTLQRRVLEFKRKGKDYGDSYYLVVWANSTWARDETNTQDYAVTVTLQADNPDLYNVVRQRVQAREQERVRLHR